MKCADCISMSDMRICQNYQSPQYHEPVSDDDEACDNFEGEE